MHLIRHWLFSRQSWIAERWLCLVAIAWGLWLLSPLWSVFAQSVVWDAMADVADETCWGGGMVVLGLMQWYGLHWRRLGVRKVAAFTMAIYWTFVAVGVALAIPLTVAPLVYGLIALLSGWTYIILTWQQDT